MENPQNEKEVRQETVQAVKTDWQGQVVPLSGVARMTQFMREQLSESRLSTACRIILESIGEDCEREGLKDTPKRFAKYWQGFIIKDLDPQFNFTTFENEGMDQMVAQANIPFFSLCEHHLLPFFGTATVGYIPDERIVGLSKLARIVDHFARRLQNQERLTHQIGDFLDENLKPKGVAVVCTARHLCMEMRGVRCKGTETTTSHLLGAFRDEPEARDEFLRFARR